MKFGLISTQAQYDELIRFAKSFPDGGHGEGHLIAPILTMHNDNGLCGYMTAINQPIYLPAWHPDMVTHREFVESLKGITTANQLKSISEQFPNGASYAAVHKDNPIADKLGRLGYKNTNLFLWRAI